MIDSANARKTLHQTQVLPQTTRDEMLTFHAFEVVTDGGYLLGVDPDKSALFAELNTIRASGHRLSEVTTIIGTVHATCIETALDAIRSNAWASRESAV